jgi:hypothetical protein
VAYSVLEAGEMPVADVAESDPITLSPTNMLVTPNTKSSTR